MTKRGGIMGTLETLKLVESDTPPPADDTPAIPQPHPVTVTAPDGPAKGVARGIDLDGALLVETPHGLLRFISGDVSVRAES